MPEAPARMKPTLTLEAHDFRNNLKIGREIWFDGTKYVITKIADATTRDESGRELSFPTCQIEAEEAT